jgi:cyclopropane fatty-acyl-phospholipid synthase-like methyltransferase
MKPYSQACDNNKILILNEIGSLLKSSKNVFEIGSGTGQHAVFFADNLPTQHWHTSDYIENHPGIIQWIDESTLLNIVYPIQLDVGNSSDWPEKLFDAVFTANTCHIMCWNEVVAMFRGVKQLLPLNGLFIIYGPFNYQDNYTSESNEQFDNRLRKRDPESGLRNFEDLLSLANKNSLNLLDDIAMPANNRLLIFKCIK